MHIHDLSKFALLCSLAFGAACSTNNTGTAAREMTDDDLQKNVEARLQLDPQVKGYDIDVDADVDERQITLSGDVPTQAVRTRAIELAKEAGANYTITDKIDVKPGDVDRSAYTEDMATEERTRATGAGEKVGNNLDDAWIHTKIRSKLAGEGEFPLGGVNVDVDNKVVTLRGTVNNAATKAEAERIAKETEGVARVNNQLRIKG